MKGLLIKDFLYIRRQGRILPIMLGLCAILIIMPFAGKEAPKPENILSLISMLTAVCALAFPLNVMGLDEQAKWDGYARSMPLSTASIVGAQYVFSAIFAAVGLVAQLVVGMVLGGVKPEDLALACVVTAGVPLLICSLMIPLYYKFGTQKASLVIMLAVFALPALFGVVIKGQETSIAPEQLLFWVKLSPVLILVLIFLSFLLSVHIYANKEI